MKTSIFTLAIENTARDLLRELVLGELESLTDLPAYDKRETCYKEDYAKARRLAERLGAELIRFPKQLRATAKQAAEARTADQAEMAELKRTGLPRWMR